METPKQSSEVRESTHVAPIIDEARQIVGRYNADVHDDETWDEKQADARMGAFREKLARGGQTSLLELYDSNSDADRRQAVRLLSQAKRESRELKPEERNEVIAAQLRVTSRETLSRSLDVYFQMLEMYKGMKQRGTAGESKDEADVFHHLRMVQTTAANRLNVAVQIKDHPEARAQLLKEALTYDRELVRLLMCQDPDIPGNNRDGLLPVHRLMLAMLKKEYEGLIAKYKVIADQGFQKAKERADRGQQALESAFPGINATKLTVEEAEPVLRSVGYASVQDFKLDTAAVKAKAGIFDRLKEEGQTNVDTLADLTAALGRFQVGRSELSSIRHHFDQGYALDAEAAPLPGKTPDEVTENMRKLFEAEQQASVGSLDRHLERVDEGVLKVGLPEKAETLWNEKGRIFITRMAQRVASLETAWIPDVPGNKDFLRDSAQEYLINGGLYDSLGWPRDPLTGKPKDWGDLTEPERKCLQEKQDSAEKAIQRFREKESMNRLRTSVDAAKALISRKDLVAEKFLGEEEIDEQSLPAEIVTAQNIDMLRQKYDTQTVYKMCFVQLKGNWEAYSEDYKELLGDFHEVVGIHLDVERYFDEFAGKQLNISINMILLALLGLFAGGAAFYAGMKTVGWGMRAGGRGVARLGKGGLRMGGRMIRSTGNTLHNTADAIKAARSSETAKKLTKMRYIEQERAIARYLQETKIGQRVTNLKTFRFLSGAAGSKAAVGTGKVLNGAAMLAVPAITAYELVENEQRVASAKKGNNADLADVYRGNRSTIALEGAGVGATLLMPGFLGPLALAGSVVYAGKHAMNRSEVRADWTRNAADWQREFGPIGSRQKLRDTTFANAVEAGGGGALRTRVGSVFESTEERDKAIDSIDQAQIAARREIYQGYFADTTLVPGNATAEERKRAVSDRMRCIHALTDGRYDNVTDTQLQMADAYAELKTRARTFERMGFSPLLSFVDAQGNQHYIDLKELENPTAANISKVVTPFLSTVRPLEDLLAFEALGDIARRTKNAKDKAENTKQVRQVLLQRLSHRLFNAERSIAVTDWSGVDLPLGITKGNTYSQNIVRAALKKRIEKEITPLTDQLMAGDLTPDAYRAANRKIENLFMDFQNAGDSNARLEVATNELTEQEREQAGSAKGSALMELLP